VVSVKTVQKLKREEEILEVLVDSDESDTSEQIIITSPTNNIVNTDIHHNNVWFSQSHPGSEEKDYNDSYQEAINSMKDRRKKDIENFSSNIKDNQVDSMLLQYKELNKTESWPCSTSIYCWWCCHPFNEAPCALPYDYKDKKFHVYGIFCSPECAASYNFDNGVTEEVWERYSLLNFMYRKINNDKNIKIKLASPRQTLKIFGGSLSMKDFRLHNSNYEKTFKVIIPPMISIIPQQEYNFLDNGYSSKVNKKYVALEKNKIINNDELRLKRERPFMSSKNTLEKCMNLKLNSD